MIIGIIGLGLIGGSLALDLKSQIHVRVLGADLNPLHCKEALSLQLIHELVSVEEIVERADLIIIAIPVDKIEEALPKILDQINDKAVVTDVGSTKKDICQVVATHTRRGRYVASHPLAGTEFSGPSAAVSQLFRNKKNIICELEKSDQDAVELVEKVFQSVGLTTYYLNPDEHDKHMAYVSHLSHVSSFMLGMTVLDIEKDEKQIFNLASTGFASTVRLAKSNPLTWSAIFSKNRYHLVTALDSYIKYLTQFRDAIKENDKDKAEMLMKEANDIKRILK